MRSRTSRGVPEWSRGEELYIGSQVSATGKVSGVIGIVPGPPEGSRGSTGWGHLSRRAPWAEVGGKPALVGWCAPPWAPPAPRVGNPRGGGASTCLGGHSTPLGRRPPLEIPSLGPAPPWGSLYKEGGGGQPHLSPWHLPPSCDTSSSPLALGEALPGSRYFNHHAIMLLDLHQPRSLERFRSRSTRVCRCPPFPSLLVYS